MAAAHILHLRHYLRTLRLSHTGILYESGSPSADSIGLGISPSMLLFTFFLASFGFATGMPASSPFVYGCRRMLIDLICLCELNELSQDT